MHRVYPRRSLLSCAALAIVTLCATAGAQADDAAPAAAPATTAAPAQPATPAAAPAPAPAASAAASAAPAQPDIVPLVDITAYVFSAPHRKGVIEVAKEHNSKLPDSCKDATFLWDGSYQLLAPIQFDSAGQLQAGAWRETVIASGCNGSRLFNVLTVGANQGATVLSLLPGTTAADPLVQRQALPKVLATPAFGGASCAERLVTDTAFLGTEGPLLPIPSHNFVGRAWHETWTVWACGKFYDTPVLFTPSDKGVEVAVDAGQIKAR
jgi:hypothetical protein